MIKQLISIVMIFFVWASVKGYIHSVDSTESSIQGINVAYRTSGPLHLKEGDVSFYLSNSDMKKGKSYFDCHLSEWGDCNFIVNNFDLSGSIAKLHVSDAVLKAGSGKQRRIHDITLYSKGSYIDSGERGHYGKLFSVSFSFYKSFCSSVDDGLISFPPKGKVNAHFVFVYSLYAILRQHKTSRGVSLALNGLLSDAQDGVFDSKLNGFDIDGWSISRFQNSMMLIALNWNNDSQKKLTSDNNLESADLEATSRLKGSPISYH